MSELLQDAETLDLLGLGAGVLVMLLALPWSRWRLGRRRRASGDRRYEAVARSVEALARRVERLERSGASAENPESEDRLVDVLRSLLSYTEGVRAVNDRDGGEREASGG